MIIQKTISEFLLQIDKDTSHPKPLIHPALSTHTQAQNSSRQSLHLFRKQVRERRPSTKIVVFASSRNSPDSSHQSMNPSGSSPRQGRALVNKSTFFPFLPDWGPSVSLSLRPFCHSFTPLGPTSATSRIVAEPE